MGYYFYKNLNVCECFYNTTNEDVICKYYTNVSCDVYGQKNDIKIQHWFVLNWIHIVIPYLIVWHSCIIQNTDYVQKY